MTYFIAPHPYHLARRWAHLANDQEAAYDFTLPVDICEENDSFLLSALVPGLKPEELNVQILEDVVTIEGKFKSDEKEFLVRELPHGSFHRTLRLPAVLDSGKSEARIIDGVLTLRLPKVESARPTTVKVTVK